MKKLLPIILVIFLLIGCGSGMNRKIDASSQEKLKQSLELIKKELKADEYEKFQLAYRTVMFSNLGIGNNVFEALSKLSESLKQDDPKLFGNIDGKTPKQIIDMAIGQTDKQIKELERKKAVAEASKANLVKITISNPKYSMRQNYFISQPIIDFTVTNNSGKPLSRIYYHGTLTTPGRSVPWIDEDFNNEISGGLENGESKHLVLQPNMFSPWTNKEAGSRKDTVFTITIVNAEDASKKNLAEDFGKTEQNQLKALNDKFNKLKS